VLISNSVATDCIEVPALTPRQISAAYVLDRGDLAAIQQSGSLPQRTQGNHRAVV
jgi:hypothetical protein